MAAPQETPAPTGFKVFVGNLSFSIDKDALEKEFQDAGKVLSANVIITRGNRSRGYGFVEMSTSGEANRAVELFHHKLIEGREVNVELARPRSAVPPNEEGGRRGGRARGRGRGRGRGGRGRGRREGESSAGDNAVANDDAGTEGASGAGQEDDEGRARGRGRGRGRGRVGRNRGRGRAGSGRGGSGEQGSSADQPSGSKAPPSASDDAEGERPRQRRQRQRRQNREPSNDTLFVANLSFQMKDNELHDLFKEFNPVEAHVVVGRTGRSKGFGFVKLANTNDQQEAIKKLDKVESMGRLLTVKVALNPEPVKEEAGEQ